MLTIFRVGQMYRSSFTSIFSSSIQKIIESAQQGKLDKLSSLKLPQLPTGTAKLCEIPDDFNLSEKVKLACQWTITLYCFRNRFESHRTKCENCRSLASFWTFFQAISDRFPEFEGPPFSESTNWHETLKSFKVPLPKAFPNQAQKRKHDDSDEREESGDETNEDFDEELKQTPEKKQKEENQPEEIQIEQKQQQEDKHHQQQQEQQKEEKEESTNVCSHCLRLVNEIVILPCSTEIEKHIVCDHCARLMVQSYKNFKQCPSKSNEDEGVCPVCLKVIQIPEIATTSLLISQHPEIIEKLQAMILGGDNLCKSLLKAIEQFPGQKQRFSESFGNICIATSQARTLLFKLKLQQQQQQQSLNSMSLNSFIKFCNIIESQIHL